MGIQAVTRPEILVQLSIPAEGILINDFPLTLNAIKNPTVFTFQRKDVSVLKVNDNGSGYCRVFSHSLITFSINSSVYLESGLYKDTGIITDIGVESGVNYVDLDVDYITDTTGGFINIASDRKNYEVQVRIYYGLYNFELYPYTLKSAVDTTGLAIVDVSSALRYICTKNININYDYVSSQDLGNCGLFYIEYREVWKNSEGAWVEIRNDWQYNYAVLQPPRPMYNNIMEKKELSFSRDTEFLTMFAEPNYYEGYPFSISFFSDILFISSLLQFEKIVRYKNINKVLRTTETTDLQTANGFGLQHLSFNDLSLNDLDEYVSIQLNVADGVCTENCYAEDYVECEYVGCGDGVQTDVISPEDPPPIIPEANPT